MTMKKLVLIYFGLVVAVAALITGLPRSVWNIVHGPDATVAAAPAADVAPVAATTAAPPSAPADEVVAMATPQPADLVAPATADDAAAVIATTDGDGQTASRLARPVVRGGDAGLDRTTSAILAELAIIPQVEATPQEAALRDMSATAMSGLSAIRGDAATAPTQTLEGLVASALREGQPDAYIDALVNEAAGTGAITVPSALVTSDGRVDTAVLLSTLVAKAQVAAGAQEPVNPTEVIAGGAGVEVQVTQTALGGSTANQFYTVSPGDSLGAIAQKFYGDAVYFPAIFEANRMLLSSPDQLNVGQRLVIPAATTL
jgi:nucleoid-associated protein YgaU